MTEPHELPSTLSDLLAMAEPLNAPITKHLLAEVVGSGNGVKSIEHGHSIAALIGAVLQLEMRLDDLEARLSGGTDPAQAD